MTIFSQPIGGELCLAVEPRETAHLQQVRPWDHGQWEVPAQGHRRRWFLPLVLARPKCTEQDRAVVSDSHATQRGFELNRSTSRTLCQVFSSTSWWILSNGQNSGQKNNLSVDLIRLSKPTPVDKILFLQTISSKIPVLLQFFFWNLHFFQFLGGYSWLIHSVFVWFLELSREFYCV